MVQVQSTWFPMIDRNPGQRLHLLLPEAAYRSLNFATILIGSPLGIWFAAQERTLNSHAGHRQWFARIGRCI